MKSSKNQNILDNKFKNESITITENNFKFNQNNQYKNSELAEECCIEL